jgi:hypothetical protein
MPRYIDADVFAERMMRVWDDADKRGRKDISRVFADIVTPLLVGTPTADVAPVVNGRWVDDIVLHPTCSECGAVVQANAVFKYGKLNYCPNCGAKMDGEENR